jgi:hypothetical protein
MPELLITVEEFAFKADLNDSPTAKKIWEALPIEGKANLWGEEIYFEIPVSMPQEANAREEVAIGTIAYWPTGEAFCIFFGPTPVSKGGEPRAYSPVNILGKIEGDLSGLKAIQQGAKVHLQKAERSST